MRTWMMLAVGGWMACACGGAEPVDDTADVEEVEVPETAAGEGPSGDVHEVTVPLEGLPEGANLTFPALDPRTGDLWFSVFTGSFDGQTIWVSRHADGGFTPPEVAPFSGSWGDRAPRFSPDGEYVLITSNRPTSPGGDPGDMNLWRVERTPDGWSAPTLLPGPVNSASPDIHPSVANTATWFASARDGGAGRSDLYRVDAEGRLEHPGAPLNDALSQPDLWISPDESWMILAITDHPDGLGGDDLYVSRRTGAAWSPPTNLGPEINSAEYEYGPSVSPDGQWLYFTSHRDGPGRVYRVALDLIPGAGP